MTYNTSVFCRIFFLIFSALFLLSCSFGSDSDTSSGSDSQSPQQNQNGTSSSPQSTSSYTANTSSRNIATLDSASFSFSKTIYINLTKPAFSADNSTWTAITSDAAEITGDSDGKKITAAYASATGGITIDSSKSSQALKIVVSGSSEKVHLYFANKKDITIGVEFNSATIISTGNYPAVSFDKKAPVYFYAEGTSSVTDGRTYGSGYGSDFATTSNNYVAEGESTKATIYSKGPVLLCGSGTLTLTENYKHGIYSKDYIRIFGGNWNINSSGRNAIQSVNGFIMDDGSVTINGTGTNTNNQSRGIIVEGEESADYCGEGFILINGGTIDITTVSKAISAKWDISEDAGTTDTSDDPYPYVKITGGTISIKTTGTPADESSSTYSFYDADGVLVSEKTKLSPEGIEGKEDVIIQGGTLNLRCTDDCINASRSGYASLTISGGKIYAYSSSNDAMDSNGTFTISGGTVVALTSTNPECAFDCDNYTFAITGGTFIGIGTNNYSKPASSACTQSTIILSGDYLGSAGTTFVLGTSASSPVFAYTIDSSIFASMKSDYIAIISSPQITKDTSYSLYAGCSVSGGTSFNGLYTSMPSVSGGTSKASGIKTSSSGMVYTLSSSTNGGAQEGQHPNPMGH